MGASVVALIDYRTLERPVQGISSLPSASDGKLRTPSGVVDVATSDATHYCRRGG